ncbi:MAG: ATP-dependent Clp protease adaptor ClpS [Clostridiales bacterium]|jgi:ATP-dependent Clp protease adaptor protein ClpS|nr:ATP-dependent Clp protease adaptor ClpS [Clostridiales bacterium]
MNAETKTRETIRELTEPAPPPFFAVVFLNDDYTTMDFVVKVLIELFGKKPEEAAALMMKIHEEGRGTAGRYVFDIAATKARQTKAMAQKEGYPLRVVVLKEDEGL